MKITNKSRISGKQEVVTKTRSRKDVSERKQRKKQLDERVVKCSLQSLVSLKVVIPEIQKRVFSISQAIHKCSLVFNRLLLYALENKISLSFLRDKNLFFHCLTIGETNLHTLHPVLKDVWNMFFQSYPKIPRYEYDADSNEYQYAAKTYKTNFLNSLVFAFQGRQKRYIKAILNYNNQDEQQWYSIAAGINNWSSPNNLSEEFKQFIKDEQKILGNNGPVTRKWLKEHPENVVKYYYNILYVTEPLAQVKKFTLAPVCKIKSHFLSIDTKSLQGILYQTKQIEKMTEKEFTANRDLYWNMTFEYKKNNKKKKLSNKEFSYMIQTDGVSACVHFLQPKKPKSTEKITFKPGQRVIAIDPGRTNLIYGVEKLPDGNIKTYKLSRHSYYNQSGMKKARIKNQKWQNEIKTEEDIFKQVSLKTTQGRVIDQFLINYYPIYDRLWQAKTQKKWSRQRFRVYCLKRSCLDTFFNSMKGTVKPVIAYGAARFNPNTKNELSAPTTSLSKKCSQFYPTTMIDEFRTTRICYDCDCQLKPVGCREIQPDGSVAYREIRGLRWCSSTKCRKFKNRDMNAALNILRCFQGGNKRPNVLDRNSGLSLVKVQSLMIS